MDRVRRVIQGPDSGVGSNESHRGGGQNMGENEYDLFVDPFGSAQSDMICITCAIRRLYVAFGIHVSPSGHRLPYLVIKIVPRVPLS